jgi:hypothetical protein
MRALRITDARSPLTACEPQDIISFENGGNRGFTRPRSHQARKIRSALAPKPPATHNALKFPLFFYGLSLENRVRRSPSINVPFESFFQKRIGEKRATRALTPLAGLTSVLLSQRGTLNARTQTV